jgi:hypothetical protein
MSRSKHTRPYHILAAGRVRAPYEPRRRDDISSERTVGRALKELGIVLDATRNGIEGEEASPLPRLVVKRPRHGRFHPLSRADVSEALRFFGESCVYGLRSISLVNGVNQSTARGVLLGAYVAPGRVLLFDQLPSPWKLAGRLPEEVVRRLHRAGANVDMPDGDFLTVVTWPGETLRTFLLFDGLMHEIGHHIIQHSKGKRCVRIVRTKDHEELADRFAQKCRLLYRARESENG